MALLYFILGILFIQYVILILDGLTTLLLAWIEAKKAKQSEIVSLANIKIRQAAASADSDGPQRLIGFCRDDEEDYYEEEDDEE